MKRDILFVFIFIIVGILAGFAGSAILMAVAIPDSASTIIPLAEKAALDQTRSSLFWSLSQHQNLLSLVLIIAALTAFAFFLYQMNPHVRTILSRDAKKAKLAVVMLASLVLFFLIFAAFSRIPAGAFSGLISGASHDLTYGFLLMLVTGTLWLVAGETGWAGDFSSWRPDASTTGKGLLITFLMGAAVGLFANFLLGLFDWSFKNYFLLVAEVLGGTSDATILGMKLLSYSIMFLMAFSLGIFAGLANAFAPRKMTVKERLIRLAIPALLLAVYSPVVAGTYRDAQQKYDLGKQSLAMAVGIAEKGTASNTLILFNPGKPVLHEWLMEVEGNGFMGSYTAELTYDNLKKIESYLQGHPDGSVFRYAALDMLIKGYHRLWDVDRGLDQMFKNGQNQMISRMMLLARLQRLTVTPEHEKYLRHLADESKWHVGKDGAIRLSRAFTHFGLADEARTWAEKARAKGADLSKEKFLNDPVFTKGALIVALRINGSPLVKAKVALVAEKKLDKIQKYTLLTKLVDVKTTDEMGKASFTHLGRGDYVLAVMTDKEKLPYNLPPAKMTIENAPTAVIIDERSPSKNLGVINIMTK